MQLPRQTAVAGFYPQVWLSKSTNSHPKARLLPKNQAATAPNDAAATVTEPEHSALWRLLAAIHISGNHDPDRLDPTRDITDAVETAFGQQFFITGRPTIIGFSCRFIHAKELKPFVVLVAAFTDAGEGFAATTAAVQLTGAARLAASGALR